MVTPVDAVEFEKLLVQGKYPEDKIRFITQGFKEGFPLCYEGPTDVKWRAANLKLNIGSKTELWNKLMKEVSLKCIAGPFEDIPFANFIQSPIGLVPKDGVRRHH